MSSIARQFNRYGNRLRNLMLDIKFEHSVFALPFAILAAFLVSDGVPDLVDFIWIVVAMVGLRTTAMGANRLIDAEIDRRNPRTAGRPLAARKVGRREVIILIVISVVLFGVAVANLDPITWYLSPIPVLLTIVYPYFKRFTSLAHFGIGLIYLIVPPAVALALTGSFDAGYVVLGVAAMLWVTGFDILYALNDYEFDCREGLKSIPVKYGIRNAIWITRVLHLVSAVLLVVAGVLLGGGVLYYVGAGVTAGLLVYENVLVRPNNLKRLNVAFFTMNGIIAVVFGVFVCLDTVI